MSRPIPDDVRRFILTSIPSVPYLEALLQLRSEPGISWDAPSLARRLYLPQPRAAELLQQLADAHFAAAAGNGWQWAPEPDDSERIAALAAAYTDNLLGVTELIHSREDRRARQFADAFRWRKEGKDNEE